MQEERQRGLALEFLQGLDEPLAEVRRQLVGREDDAEGGDEVLAEVAQQRDLLDLDAVRGALALRALLGLEEVARGDLPFDEDLRVELHEGQPGLVVLAEQGEFERAAVVLHGHAGALRAVARRQGLDVRDDAGHGGLAGLVLALAFVDAGLQLGELAVREGFDLEAVAVERVGRQVHADVFLLLLEQAQDILLADHHRGFRTHGLELLDLAEQGVGRVELVVAVEAGVLDDLVDEEFAVLAGLEVLRALEAEGVEGAGIDERLDAAAVEHLRHALDEVEQVGEGAVGRALLDDGVHDVLAEALEAAQAVADVALLVDGELGVGFVDVGAEDLDAGLAAVRHDLLHLVHVRDVLREVGGLEFGRIVGLDPGGLVAHPGVAGGVGLVEGVFGEGLPVGPDLLQDGLRVAVGQRALHEGFLERVEHGFLLLAHGLAELVGLALGEAGQLLRQAHDLLLVDRDAVGLLEELLHLGEVVVDLGRVVLARHEVRDVVHRARTVEGVHGDQVLETLGVQADQPLLHAAGFELEDALGVAAGVEVVDRRVVDGDLLDVDVRAEALLDEGQGAVDDGEGLEPEEVHLEHAHILDLGAFVLADPDFLARGLVDAHRDGDVVREVAAADDHGAGVDAGLADAAFELEGVVEHLAHQRVTVFVFLLELLDVFDAVGERGLVFLVLAVLPDHDGAVGDHLGEAVGLRDGEVGDARHVLDGQLGGHGAEGDDVGDVVGAVVVLDVLDHAVAAFVVEVHVDIRHRDALRVEETLEQKVVADRVEVGDAEAVRHAGAGGGATARADGHAVAAAPVDEVLDDEEVVREAHERDRHELEMQAVLLLLGEGVAVAAAGAFVGEVAEVGHRPAEFVAAVVLHFASVGVLGDVVLAVLDDVGVFREVRVDLREELLREVELREDVAAVDLVTLHLVQHLEGVGEGLRMVREERRHLLLALEVLLLGVAEALGVVDHRVGGQADEPVVRRAVLLADEVDVVGGHDLDAVFLRQLEDAGGVFLLALVELEGHPGDLRLVEHHLEVVVVAEDALVPLDRLVHAFLVAGEDPARDLARHAGGAADEVFVVALQHLVAHARLVVHALDVSGGHDLHEVLVAVVVLGEQDEVVVLLVVVVLEVVVVVLRDVDLAAEDGLDVRMLLGHVAEVLDAVHVAVVGDGEAGHAQFFGPAEELLDVAHPVEDGVLGMDVQVYEGHGCTKIHKNPRPSAGRGCVC